MAQISEFLYICYVSGISRVFVDNNSIRSSILGLGHCLVLRLKLFSLQRLPLQGALLCRYVGSLLYFLKGWSNSVDMAADCVTRQPSRGPHTDLSLGGAICGEELHLQAPSGLFVHNEVDP